MRVSLCMIVRDEEQQLPGCLDSVRGAVDEIIVVDTGSGDRTIGIAREHGARVFTEPWADDFAQARNQSLRRATGDWILVLDADERLAPESAARLRDVLASTTSEGLRVLIRDHVSPTSSRDVLVSASTRLFRNRPEYRYERRIHEQIETSIVAAGLGEPPRQADLVVEHFGNLGQVVWCKGKRLRNLSLLEREVEEVGDGFAHFNLGVEYIRHGRYEDALAALTKAGDMLDQSLVIAAETLHRRAICLTELGRYAEALEILERGTGLYPDFPDLRYQQGQVLYRLHRQGEAIEALLRCREAGEAAGRYYSLQGIAGYRAAYAIGLAHHELQDHAQALVWYRKSLQENQGFRDALLRIAELLKESLRDGEAIDREIARYFDMGQTAARVVYLQVLYHIERYETVWPLAVQLVAETGDDPHILLLGAISAFRCGNRSQALAWSRQLLEAGASEEDALLLVTVAHWCAGDLPAAQDAVTRLGRRPREMLFAVCQQMQWLMEGRAVFSLHVDHSDPKQAEEYAGAALTVLRLVISSGHRGVLEKVLPVLRPVEDLGVWVDLGLAYHRGGLHDLALAELADCEERGAYSAESLFVLGKLLLLSGEARRASGVLHRALELQPHHIELRLLLAAAYRQLALEVLEAGVTRYPGAPMLVRQLELLRKGGEPGGNSQDGGPGDR